MRGLSDSTPASPMPGTAAGPEPERPDIEALTPPPVESLTPVGTPPPLDPADDRTTDTTTAAADMLDERVPPSLDELAPSHIPPPNMQVPGLSPQSAVQAQSHPKPLDPRRRRGHEGVNGSAEGAGAAAKRRKTSGMRADDDFAEFTSGGLDSDVAEMLGRE